MGKVGVGELDEELDGGLWGLRESPTGRAEQLVGN